MLSLYRRALFPGRTQGVNECIMCHQRGTLIQRDFVQRPNFFAYRAFFECRECGFVFDALGGPTPDSFYEQNYSSDRFDRSAIDFRYRTSEAVELSLCLVNSRITPSRVLEIGPGPGWFMEAFLKCNPETAYDVVELTEYGAETCRKAGAQQVYSLNFETDSRIGDLMGRYDVVVSIHCIEHLFNPLAALANMLRCVKPGGILYLHTPNHGNARENSWFHYTAPDHICFFSEKSFTRLGDVLGYNVLAMQVAYDNNDIISILRPRPGVAWRARRAMLARSQRLPAM